MAASVMAPLLIFGGFTALIGGIAYIAHLQNKRRNEAMTVVAQTMGFTYQQEYDKTEMVTLAGALPVFDRGHSKQAKRVLRGQLAKRDAVIFDYAYVTGGGKSSQHHHQTIVMFPEGGRGMPDFVLAPENVFHRLIEIFGYQDIDFEGNEAFSKSYLLRGADDEAIRRVFDGDAVTLLGGTAGWCVQTKAGRLAVFREGGFARPEEIPNYAAEALRIAGALRSTDA